MVLLVQSHIYYFSVSLMLRVIKVRLSDKLILLCQ